MRGFAPPWMQWKFAMAPLPFPHSNPMAVCDHYRSITDEQIKACVATGGVVGINGVGTFVGDDNAPTEAIFSLSRLHR